METRSIRVHSRVYGNARRGKRDERNLSNRAETSRGVNRKKRITPISNFNKNPPEREACQKRGNGKTNQEKI